MFECVFWKKKESKPPVNLLFERLLEDYFALYYVDLGTGFARVIKESSWYPTGGEGYITEYPPMMKSFAAAYEGETKSFFDRNSSIEYLQRRFIQENKATYSYKSQFAEGERWVCATELVLKRNEDGTPAVLALGFSLLDRDVAKKEEAQLMLKQSMEVVGGLASEYTGLYHVNLNTGEYVPYHVAEKIQDIKPFYERHEKFVDLAKAFAESSLVAKEDKEVLYHLYPSDEDVRRLLRGRKTISTLFRRNYKGEYRWTEAIIIKCEDVNEEAQNVIVGFVEKDEEVKRQRATKELLKHAEENRKLLQNMATNYNIVYLVNMERDSFKLFKMDEGMAGKGEAFANFTEAKEFFFDKALHPADQERMRRELEYSVIRERMESEKTYNVEYRALINNTTIWHEMNVTSFGPNEVAIGFAIRDEEITKRHLQDKNYQEYLALFVIDIDTEMIKSIIVSDIFKTAPVGEAMPYRQAVEEFASIHKGSEREFFDLLSDLEYVKREFRYDDKRTYSYKTDWLEGDNWVDVTGYVIDRHADGTPAMFTLGFTKVDALSTARKDLQERLVENMQIIGGLASEYHAMYYYNIDEDTFKIYSLDKEKFPEVAKIVDQDITPLQAFQMFGNSEMIHPEDKPLFAGITPDYIREKLSHKKSFSLLFRRSFEGEFLWTRMKVIKYEDIDEPANAVSIGFTECDAAIRNEQMLNSCFSVLAKEMSPVEAINELLGKLGDFFAAERAYVFEFQKNGTVITNTFEWCAPGVEAMITNLQDVPSKEIDGWMDEFRRQGAFYMDSRNNEHNSEGAIALLEMQGINSLIAAPIMNGDEIKGFIGIDNPKKSTDSTALLKNIAVAIYSEVLKRRENDEEHITLGKLTDAFVSVYYTDISKDYMRTWKIAEEYKDAYGAVKHYSESMGGYVRNYIAEEDRERCIRMTSPEYVLNEFKTKDRYSIPMKDIMTGVERDFVFDYIKVSEDGNQFVVCCRDTTATLAKEREQQKLLEEALIAADKASKSKTSFLFNMSHDIRTPMNAITGFTQMAKKYADNSERVIEYLDKIDISGQQLLTLINQVLEMARIESGKTELDENHINIQEEFDSMITVLDEQAKVSGLELHYSIADIRHNYVLADRARMGSITLNIAGNAMKYTPRGGSIDFSLREIASRREGYGTYLFTVVDTGIGMSEEYLDILFEPFSREKNSTVSKIQGTGLGMSIVKNLVDLMGGNINVQSEVGKGTKFDVIIDFKLDEEGIVPAETAEHIDERVFEGMRALLVEDNDMNREIAKDLLEEFGFIIEDAEDGDVAVAMVKETIDRGEPDYYKFILMDVQMPTMDGYEATKQIRALPVPEGVHIPIIAMTANAFEEDRQNALSAGMDEHLAKPIEIQKLLKTLFRFVV